MRRQCGVTRTAHVVRSVSIGIVATVMVAACGGDTPVADTATTSSIEVSASQPAPDETTTAPDPTVAPVESTSPTNTPATSAAAVEAPVDVPSVTTVPTASGSPNTTVTATTITATATVAAAPQPVISADELAALEQALDDIDQLLTDIELDVQQD